MQERSILGTAVGFPDAMRFKGAAPEIINSRCEELPVLDCTCCIVHSITLLSTIAARSLTQPTPSDDALVCCCAEVTSYVALQNIKRLLKVPLMLCRLAMLGFVAAVAAELATGRTVAEQVRISPGPIAAVFALFSVASLIPILKVRNTDSSRSMQRATSSQALTLQLPQFMLLCNARCIPSKMHACIV